MLHYSVNYHFRVRLQSYYLIFNPNNVSNLKTKILLHFQTFKVGYNLFQQMNNSTYSRMKCSQMFSIISAIILIVMGIIAIAVSIWLLKSENWQIIFSYQINLLSTFMIVAGSIMIIGGIYGAYAAYHLSNNHLSGFFGIMILSSFLLMISGVLGFALPLRVITAGCGSTLYPVISSLNYTATLASKVICVSCTCYINSTAMPLDKITNRGYNYNTMDSTIATKAQDCTNDWEKTTYDDLYAQLETSFKCAGWCPGTEGSIFKMTNVNNGVPSKSCFEATTTWFQSFARVMGICAFVFGGIIILLLGFVWWNLCQIVDSQTEYYLRASKFPFYSPVPAANMSMNNTIGVSEVTLPPTVPVPQTYPIPQIVPQLSPVPRLNLADPQFSYVGQVPQPHPLSPINSIRRTQSYPVMLSQIPMNISVNQNNSPRREIMQFPGSAQRQNNRYLG